MASSMEMGQVTVKVKTTLQLPQDARSHLDNRALQQLIFLPLYTTTTTTTSVIVNRAAEACVELQLRLRVPL